MDDPHLEADRLFGPCLDPDCPGSTVPGTQPDAASYPGPVTLTRRTPRFGELATGVEERLSQLGIVVDPKRIDDDLRVRIRAVAEQLGVTDRTALGHASDDLADDVARAIVVTAKALLNGTEGEPRRRHLSVVR